MLEITQAPIFAISINTHVETIICYVHELLDRHALRPLNRSNGTEIYQHLRGKQTGSVYSNFDFMLQMVQMFDREDLFGVATLRWRSVKE